MCIDNFQYVCGELIHVFQRHDLKCYQALLILSERKKAKHKQTQKKESNLQHRNMKMANSQPSHFLQECETAVGRELLCMQLIQILLTYILCCFWLGYSGMGWFLVIAHQPLHRAKGFPASHTAPPVLNWEGQGAVRGNSWDPHASQENPEQSVSCSVIKLIKGGGSTPSCHGKCEFLVLLYLLNCFYLNSWLFSL